MFRKWWIHLFFAISVIVLGTGWPHPAMAVEIYVDANGDGVFGDGHKLATEMYSSGMSTLTNKQDNINSSLIAFQPTNLESVKSVQISLSGATPASCPVGKTLSLFEHSGVPGADYQATGAVCTIAGSSFNCIPSGDTLTLDKNKYYHLACQTTGARADPDLSPANAFLDPDLVPDDEVEAKISLSTDSETEESEQKMMAYFLDQMATCINEEADGRIDPEDRTGFLDGQQDTVGVTFFNRNKVDTSAVGKSTCPNLGDGDTLDSTDYRNSFLLAWNEPGDSLKIQYVDLIGSNQAAISSVKVGDTSVTYDSGAGRWRKSADIPQEPVSEVTFTIGVDGETPIETTTFQVSAGSIGPSFSSDYMTGIEAGGWSLSCFPNDFNCDGQPDVLYRHPTSGNIGVWLMNGTTEDTWQYIGNHGTSWDVMGTGDFNLDGQPDIVFRDPQDGDIGVWQMSGFTEDTWRYIGNHGTSWDVRGVGDFNSDGRQDIVYRHPGNGNIGVWEMSRFTEDAWLYIGNHGTTWDIGGVGDFNSDGYPDIVYRHPENGNIGVWLMNGTTEDTWQLVGNHGPGWEPKSLADYNNDGHLDMVYQNVNGMVGVWSMNGTQEQTWHPIKNHGDWAVR